MLFRKKKKEEKAEEVESKEVEYSPDELKLIRELTEEFDKAPGQVDLDLGEPSAGEEAPEEPAEEEFPEPPQGETKEPSEMSEFDDLLDLENLEEVEISPEGEEAEPMEEPSFEEPALEEAPEEPAEEETSFEEITPDTDLGLDLDNIVDTIEETEPEFPSAEEELGDFDLGAPEEPVEEESLEPETSEDFSLGEELAEEAPEPEEDLGMEETPEPEEDLGMGEDLGLEEDLGLGEDLGMEEDLGEAPLEDLDLEGVSEETPDLEGFDLEEETPAEDLGLETMEEPSAEPASMEEDFDLEPTEPAIDLGAEMPAEEDFGLSEEQFGEEPQMDTDLSGDLGLGETPMEEPEQEPLMESPSEMTDMDLDVGTGEAGGFDDFAPPSLDELSPELAVQAPKGGLSSELSDLAMEHTAEMPQEDLNILRQNLKKYSPLSRQAIIETLLNNKLSEKKSEELIQKIISGAPETDAKEFIEANLDVKLSDLIPKSEIPRKVIVSRPQYTEKGLARQARVIKLTKFAVIAALLFAILGSAGWLFVIKRILYKRNISNGIDIIMTLPEGGSRDKAEEFFQEAINLYPDKSEAYLRFAEAYRKGGYYDEAFEKLFGKISIIRDNKKAVRYQNVELTGEGKRFWRMIQKVPIISFENPQAPPPQQSALLSGVFPYFFGDEKPSQPVLIVNGLRWKLEKEGAYIISHLRNKKDEAIVLYALGMFHSSPSSRFNSSVYRNNRLGIAYFQRILNFAVSTPAFQKSDFLSKAVLGIGNIYYNQGDYDKAHDYFDKIRRQNPKNVDAQTGLLRTLIKIYSRTDDPRMIIQQHSKIKHTLNIEDKLPLHILAKLAEFYINLPEGEHLRIQYNVSPIDKVNNKTLKSRAEELLNIIFSKTDTDIYGNETEGKTFAEGYYQRGRYYRYVVKEVRMAMTQFEYAIKYNPNHFMALNDRAEILIELHDYEQAQKYLKDAIDIIESKGKQANLGDNPEDETLIEADRGKIYFNMGKALYLSTVVHLDTKADRFRINELSNFSTQTQANKSALFSLLDQTDQFFNKAEKEGIKDDHLRAELDYYRGWYHYVKNEHKKALFHWQSIDQKWDKKYPNLELAKSYALYALAKEDPAQRKKLLQMAMGHLIYIHKQLTPRAEKIGNIRLANYQHVMIYSKLAIVENNMGAIFEMLGEQHEKEALEHYWKSVEYSNKISYENEVARMNIRLGFKREGLEPKEKYPLIMDFVSPYLQDQMI